jgi:FtsH-binding integral membrane protein
MESPLLNTDGPPTGNESTFVKDATTSARLGFVRKVYGIVGAQLLVTAAIAAPVSSSLKTMAPSSVQALLIVSSIMTFLPVLALICSPDLAKKVPQNYFILFTFTAFQGVLVGAVCATYSTQVVVSAMLATAIVVGGLTLYAWNTKSDFTGMGPYMVAALLAFTVGVIAMRLVCMSGVCPPMTYTLFALAGVAIFSMYLVYDTQLILGQYGGHDRQFELDDYVFAAIQLYLDIINLFLYILELFGGDRN